MPATTNTTFTLVIDTPLDYWQLGFSTKSEHFKASMKHYRAVVRGVSELAW